MDTKGKVKTSTLSRSCLIQARDPTLIPALMLESIAWNQRKVVLPYRLITFLRIRLIKQREVHQQGPHRQIVKSSTLAPNLLQPFLPQTRRILSLQLPRILRLFNRQLLNLLILQRVFNLRILQTFRYQLSPKHHPFFQKQTLPIPLRLSFQIL
jgi:hypothetical protein